MEAACIRPDSSKEPSLEDLIALSLPNGEDAGLQVVRNKVSTAPPEVNFVTDDGVEVVEDSLGRFMEESPLFVFGGEVLDDSLVDAGDKVEIVLGFGGSIDELSARLCAYAVPALELARRMPEARVRLVNGYAIAAGVNDMPEDRMRENAEASNRLLRSFVERFYPDLDERVRITAPGVDDLRGDLRGRAVDAVQEVLAGADRLFEEVGGIFDGNGFEDKDFRFLVSNNEPRARKEELLEVKKEKVLDLFLALLDGGFLDMDDVVAKGKDWLLDELRKHFSNEMTFSSDKELQGWLDKLGLSVDEEGLEVLRVAGHCMRDIEVRRKVGGVLKKDLKGRFPDLKGGNLKKLKSRVEERMLTMWSNARVMDYLASQGVDLEYSPTIGLSSKLKWDVLRSVLQEMPEADLVGLMGLLEMEDFADSFASYYMVDHGLGAVMRALGPAVEVQRAFRGLVRGARKRGGGDLEGRASSYTAGHVLPSMFGNVQVDGEEGPDVVVKLGGPGEGGFNVFQRRVAEEMCGNGLRTPDFYTVEICSGRRPPYYNAGLHEVALSDLGRFESWADVCSAYDGKVGAEDMRNYASAGLDGGELLEFLGSQNVTK